MMPRSDDTPHYKRIAAQNGGMFSRGSLWLADDHLLQILTFLGMHERYQRFYLRDIKAIMTTDSSTSAVMSVIGVFFSFLFGLMAGITSLANGRFAASPGLWIMFFVFLFPTLLALWRGRTIKVFVVTEVQTTLLSSIARKSQARKFLAQLTPLIQAAQADWVVVPESPSPNTPTNADGGAGGA